MAAAQRTTNSQMSRNTWVSLGMVVSFVVAVGTGSWHMSRIYYVQQDVLRELNEIHRSIERGTVDRWTGSDMSRWVDFTNREVEVWSLEAERSLNIPVGTWRRFTFPDPELVNK